MADPSILMPNIIARFSSRVVDDFRRIAEAKTTIGIASLLLIAATAYATWTIAVSHYAEQFATIEATTRNLLVQVGQLSKDGGPRSPHVYGSSRLQLLDIHVTFDPPHKPNILRRSGSANLNLARSKCSLIRGDDQRLLRSGIQVARCVRFSANHRGHMALHESIGESHTQDCIRAGLISAISCS